MKKKKLRLLITSILSVGVVSATILASNNISPSLNVNAGIEPYTLTIDASNKSNFVQDGDVYRGTFKTGFGNDIVFRMKSAPSSKEGVTLEMTSKNDYLINETPLRGVTSMEVTGHYINNQGELRANNVLYFYYLADLDMANLDNDSLTNSTNRIYSVNEFDHTYVVNTGSGIGRAGSAYYYIGNKDYFYSGYTWVIDSVKYYFSCQSTKTYVSVTSSNSSLGEVSINGETFVSSRYTVVANGTSVTIHANPISDFENEQLYSFKGWHLNGSEEYISTNPDYTFTTAQDGSYKFVAEFGEAETELFSQGEHIAAKAAPHTFVYSQKANKYYSIIGAHDPNGTHTHTDQQDTTNNNLFIERHEFIQGGSSYKSYFKLNSYSPTRLVYDLEQGKYVDKKWLEDDQIEKFDPTKVQAVIFYLAMDESGRIDELSSTNGTFTTYKNLQDPLDDNKAMSKVVWTGFTSDVADVYVPSKYWNGEADGTLWIKRMKVVYC